MNRPITDAAAGRGPADRLIAELGLVRAGGRLRVAGLIYTYRCTIGCRHCGFGCRPGRPDVHQTTAQVLRNLRMLHELGRVVHVAGGEAMLYWDDLAEALTAAHEAGLAPHFIETNCSFAADDAAARRRLEFLASRGLAGVLLSADPYHQEHVPPERFCRVRRIAREIFGQANVWCTDAPDERIGEFAAIARDERRLRAHVREHPPVIVCTAYQRLRGYLDDHPVAEMPLEAGWGRRYATPDCMVEWSAETMWEIHIDPYDNIQTNCGIILGSVTRTTPRAVLAAGPENANWVAGELALRGPGGAGGGAAGASRRGGARPRAHQVQLLLRDTSRPARDVARDGRPGRALRALNAAPLTGGAEKTPGRPLPGRPGWSGPLVCS